MDIYLPSRTIGDSEPWRKNGVNKWKWKKKIMVDDKKLKVVQEGRIVRRKAWNEGKSKLIKDLTFSCETLREVEKFENNKDKITMHTGKAAVWPRQ